MAQIINENDSVAMRVLSLSIVKFPDGEGLKAFQRPTLLFKLWGLFDPVVKTTFI
jgi:hypothetical protein